MPVLDRYGCPRPAYHFICKYPISFVGWTDFRIFIWPDVSPGWVSPAQLLHYRKKVQLLAYSTFMGIAIHNLSVSAHAEDVSLNLAAAVRQIATGLLGTTVQLADLVRALKIY